MNSSHVVITGGEGDLATAIANRMCAASMAVFAPGREELDVTHGDQVGCYFKQLESLDLLICNAGVTVDAPLAKMSEAQWEAAMEVNLKGAFICAREASRLMVKQRVGHIIFISSFSALQPPAGQANYAASKAALLGMMKSLARELGPRNIRVNAILPGFLETKMTKDLSPKARQASLQKHSLARWNTPASVADFVSCLHTDMVHTSGQVFNLDSRILS